MKSIQVLFFAVITSLFFNAANGAAPEILTLNDLRDHPERWPAKVTLPQDFKFQGGISAKKGQVVQVVDLKGSEMVVDAGNDLVFTLPAVGSDLLANANASWQKLSPAQRELDANAVLADSSLWPVRVKSANPFRLDNGTQIPPGSEFELVSLGQNGVTLYSPKYSSQIGADFKDTDLITRARALVLLPAKERPSRIAAALTGNLVDGAGKPTAPKLDDAQIFALYYGASWCGPCRKFSPSLVKYVNQVSAQNPKLTVILMSNDKVDADMLGYMKTENMPWVAMPLAKLRVNPLLLGYTKGSIPQLVIVDRSGKVLADSYQGTRYVGPEVALKTLEKLIQSGGAR